MKKHLITRYDCQKVVDVILHAFSISGLDKMVDFLVYGSLYGDWRDGLSDLDAILYFRNEFNPDCFEIEIFQEVMAKLYEKVPYIDSYFFADVFVVDNFHATDGRFLFPFDKDWINIFWKYTKFEFVHGHRFIDKVNAVSLRNQNELELAMGLTKLRNYLLFEIPRPQKYMSMNRSKEVLKFFKVLPRTSTIIMDKPMTRTAAQLKRFEFFSELDLVPLYELWADTIDYKSTEKLLRSWHTQEGQQKFVKCLLCFEAVLRKMVTTTKAKSV